MKKWKVVSYNVPEADNGLRLQILSESENDNSPIPFGDDVVWSGRPHLPLFRWSFLIFGILGLLNTYFAAFVLRLPFAKIWLVYLFGFWWLSIPILGTLRLMMTEYCITKEKILVINRFFRTIYKYDIPLFSKRTDIFGFLGSYRQPSGTYDVQFIKRATALYGRAGGVDGTYFESVTKSDKDAISNALNALISQTLSDDLHKDSKAE